MSVKIEREKVISDILVQKENLYATGDDYKLLLVDAPYTRQSLIRYIIRISSGYILYTQEGVEKELFVGKGRALRLFYEFANRQIPKEEMLAARAK